MVALAFSVAIPMRGSSMTNKSSCQPKRIRFYTGLNTARKPMWHASSVPEPEKSGSSAEDDALNRELRNKVNELFGSRQNIKIEMETDSGVQFTIRNRNLAADDQQTKAAWMVIGSIAVISVFAGIIFFALFYSGAVHNAADQTQRRYEVPTYGKSSYINPYELLEEDRNFQDNERQYQGADIPPDY